LERRLKGKFEEVQNNEIWCRLCREVDSSIPSMRVFSRSGKMRVLEGRIRSVVKFEMSTVRMVEETSGTVDRGE
jgi:hypothetical protein